MRQKAVLVVVQEISDDSEIVAQLKEKYSTADRSEKIQVLTLLPGIDSLDLFISICSGIVLFHSRQARLDLVIVANTLRAHFVFHESFCQE